MPKLTKLQKRDFGALVSSNCGIKDVLSELSRTNLQLNKPKTSQVHFYSFENFARLFLSSQRSLEIFQHKIDLKQDSLVVIDSK